MDHSLKYVTKVLLDYATKLTVCSAETRLIIQTTERLAHAFGYKNAEVIVSPTHIVVSVTADDEMCSLQKRVDGININMHNLYELTSLCLQVEHGKTDILGVEKALKELKAYHYPPIVMCIMIGLATFSFAYLNGGSFEAAFVGLFAGAITMAIRLFMQHKHLFIFFVFAMSGLVATVVTMLIHLYIYQLKPADLQVALTVSVLLLVPGFPFINGILDVFKGYNSMGVGRLFTAIILLSCVCVGIIMGLALFNREVW